MSNFIVDEAGKLLNVNQFEVIALDEAKKILAEIQGKAAYLQAWITQEEAKVEPADAPAAPSEPAAPQDTQEPAAPASDEQPAAPAEPDGLNRVVLDQPETPSCPRRRSCSPRRRQHC